ncbi:MAG: glycosyltransferase family 2 protein [Paludibacter sp.]
MSIYKVSVLVPIYNAENYIQKCAHSLLAQTLESIEYVFVDDCSADKSISILKTVIEQYPDRTNDIKIITHNVNKGISAARQSAFDVATGEYLLAMDSDDYIETDMLESLYNHALANHSDMVFCDYISEFKNETKIRKIPFSTDKKKQIEFAIRGNSALWNKIFKRSILVENNIRTLTGIDHGDDLAVLIKLLYHSNQISYLPKHFYHYIESNQHSTTKKFKPKYIDDRLKLVNEVVVYLEKGGLTFQNEILLMKSLRKAKILMLTHGDKQYVDLFPEINKHFMTLDMNISLKLMLYISKIKNPLLQKYCFQLANFRNK